MVVRNVWPLRRSVSNLASAEPIASSLLWRRETIYDLFSVGYPRDLSKAITEASLRFVVLGDLDRFTVTGSNAKANREETTFKISTSSGVHGEKVASTGV